MKEWFRKKLVYIKRNPQIFPKLLLVITCCFFTFNLTAYSYATVDITNPMPAISVFIITLFSFLMIFSFVGVGKKLTAKPAPLIITLAILAVQIVLQIAYIVILKGEIAAFTGNIELEHASWPASVNLTIGHLVLLAATVVSIVTMPLYARQLAKLNTARPEAFEEDGLSDGLLIVEDEDTAALEEAKNQNV